MTKSIDWFKAVDAVSKPPSANEQYREGLIAGCNHWDVDLDKQTEDYKAGYAKGYQETSR